MPWQLVWRAGARVERVSAATLDAALDALEERVRVAAAGPRAEPLDLRARRWEPRDQVAARGEVRGPQRWRPALRAGADVRGDGSVQAWSGAPSREAIEPRDGEDPCAALRRVVQSISVEP